MIDGPSPDKQSTEPVLVCVSLGFWCRSGSFFVLGQLEDSLLSNLFWPVITACTCVNVWVWESRLHTVFLCVRIASEEVCAVGVWTWSFFFFSFFLFLPVNDSVLNDTERPWWEGSSRRTVGVTTHATHTHTHTYTHTLLTHSLTVIIRPSETKRLRGFYSPLQRVQIIQLANVSDWVLDLIKCGLHTSAVVVRVSSRVGKHKLDWMRVEIKDVKMKVVQWASDIRRERLALLPHIWENGEMRHTNDKLIKS